MTSSAPLSSKPRKIAFSAGHYDGGGIGQAFLQLSAAFVSRGHSVDLLVVATGPTQRIVPEGVQEHWLAPRALKSLIRLVSYFRRAQPDVVIVARNYIGLITCLTLLLARRWGKCQLIWTFHTDLEYQPLFSGRFKTLLHHFVCFFMRRASHLVGVSNGVSRCAERVIGVPPQSVRTIPNAVWNDARLANAKSLSGSSFEHPTILACTRLEPQKNLTMLLEAFSTLPKDLGAKLVLAGDGSEREALEAKAKDLHIWDHVSFLGHVDQDCIGMMLEADCLAMSSRYEGAPVVLVEAMVAGLPIVSTNCDFGPMEILDNGRLGRLVPVDDTSAFAKALEESLREGKSETVQQAQWVAAQRYHTQTICQSYEALFAEWDDAS